MKAPTSSPPSSLPASSPAARPKPPPPRPPPRSKRRSPSKPRSPPRPRRRARRRRPGRRSPEGRREARRSPEEVIGLHGRKKAGPRAGFFFLRIVSGTPPGLTRTSQLGAAPGEALVLGGHADPGFLAAQGPGEGARGELRPVVLLRKVGGHDVLEPRAVDARDDRRGRPVVEVAEAPGDAVLEDSRVGPARRASRGRGCTRARARRSRESFSSTCGVDMPRSVTTASRDGAVREDVLHGLPRVVGHGKRIDEQVVDLERRRADR